MKSFKVTGTPGEPVRLDTLKAGDWYVRQETPFPEFCHTYPCCVVYHQLDGWTKLLRQNESGTSADMSVNLVHPLTRHEHDDGTVEFRHVGKEVKDEPCPACNGTGVKPAPEPEPTSLERLPEAVREFIDDYVAPGECDPEALARTIFEHRDAIFAAGEPEERSRRFVCITGDDGGLFDWLSVWPDNDGSGDVTVGHDQEGINFTCLSRSDTIEMARRMVALASKGGAQ